MYLNSLCGLPLPVADKLLTPLISYGVKCMSVGFMVPEDAATIWRGPMVKIHQSLILTLTMTLTLNATTIWHGLMIKFPIRVRVRARVRLRLRVRVSNYDRYN